MVIVYPDVEKASKKNEALGLIKGSVAALPGRDNNMAVKEYNVANDRLGADSKIVLSADKNGLVCTSPRDMIDAIRMSDAVDVSADSSYNMSIEFTFNDVMRGVESDES